MKSQKILRYMLSNPLSILKLRLPFLLVRILLILLIPLPVGWIHETLKVDFEEHNHHQTRQPEHSPHQYREENHRCADKLPEGPEENFDELLKIDF